MIRWKNPLNWLTGICVSLPPIKNIPNPLLSAAISIVMSFPGRIGHVRGSAGGSKIRHFYVNMKPMTNHLRENYQKLK